MVDIADWEAQRDEVQALAAIYEDDFQVTSAIGTRGGGSCELDPLAVAATPCPEDGWCLQLELAVRVDLPCGGGVPVCVDTGQAACSREQGGSGVPGGDSLAESPSFLISHLPPIMLVVRTGPGYPSRHPPEVKLSALWLTSSQQVAALEAKLQEVWEVQGPGLPVVFGWTEWLRSAALEEIGAAQCLLLGSSHSEGEGLDDAVPATSSTLSNDSEGGERLPAEATLMALMRYSAARELSEFQGRMHSCPVCLEEQQGSQFVRLRCGHAYCGACAAEQARILVAEGALAALKCPDPGCGAALEPSMLRRVLPLEAYERWEQLTLQRALDTMSDAAWCPRCNTVSIEDASENCADCPRCFYVFCTLCNEARHPGVRCVSAETRLEMLRRKAEGGGAAAVEDLRRKEQELLSLAAVEQMSRPCPSCSAAISRTEGCNKMCCGNCGAFFCWKCGQAIAGYEHFRTGSSCILFDEAEVLRWEQQFELEVERHAAAQARNEWMGEMEWRRWQGDGGEGGGDGAGEGAAPVRGRRGGAGAWPAAMPSAVCPSCGQRCFKMGGNNHMRCWSCNRHFCAVCRKVLQRRGGTHFGAGGCKQHS